METNQEILIFLALYVIVKKVLLELSIDSVFGQAFNSETEQKKNTIQNLRQQLKSISQVQEFARYAKIERQILKIEKELKQTKEPEKTALDKLFDLLFQYKLPTILKTAVYIVFYVGGLIYFSGASLSFVSEQDCLFNFVFPREANKTEIPARVAILLFLRAIEQLV